MESQRAKRHAQNLYERYQTLLSASLDDYVGIEPIIEFGHPIVGIVSDGQQSIRLAFETLLLDVPYQYCQYHYLKDIAKPVADADRKLKMELKKSMRGIRDIERTIEQVEAKTVETGNKESKQMSVHKQFKHRYNDA